MRSILVGALLLTSASCETIGFYRQAIAGQWAIVRAKQSNSELIASPATSPALRKQLQLVADLLKFATVDLSLDPKHRYQNFVRIDRKHVVWNVFAAPEFSTRPVRWCYPVAGCATYRGYFSQADARRYTQDLTLQRRDTIVGGVAAYSTLGWFDDPVLSSFIEWPDTDLAGLIFHELAHARVFVPGDTPFNEAFASFVERHGVLEWLRIHQDQTRIERILERWKRSDRFVAYLLNWRDELQRLYDQPYNTVARRLLKTELLAAVEQCYRANAALLGDQDWYFNSGPINNARFVPLAAYHELLGSFEVLFEEAGRSWPLFYSRVADLARLDARAREDELERLGNVYRSDHASDGDVTPCEALVF